MLLHARLSRTLPGVAIALATLTALPSTTQAQRDETLLGRRGASSVGGFGGPVVKISRLAGADAVFSGGRGGVILNRRLAIGGGGYAVTSENIRTDFRFPDGSRPSLQLAYGGVEFEYITRSRELVHATVSVLLGGGAASYRSRETTGGSVATQTLESEVFVAEPAANLELNVTRWFRPGIGVGYRYVNGSDLPGTTDGALSGAVGTITFKFGSF